MEKEEFRRVSQSSGSTVAGGGPSATCGRKGLRLVTGGSDAMGSDAPVRAPPFGQSPPSASAQTNTHKGPIFKLSRRPCLL